MSEGAATPPARRRGVLPLNNGVAVRMSRMPRRDTKPEVAVRRELHRLGVRFRLHPSELPGKPDIALPRAKLAVFIDGCFWHRCPLHGTEPKNNRAWWAEKLDRNQQRDLEKDAALQALGWRSLHFWEHEPPDVVARTVETEWRRRTGRPVVTTP